MHKALFFGSFNPIHNGHLAIAQYVIDNAIADEVLFVVSPGSPFKNPEVLLDKQMRLELVELAIMDMPHIFVSDAEFYMPLPSFTADTLRVFRKQWSDSELSILLGADQLEGFHRWKNYLEIIKFHKVFLYPRKGTPSKIPDDLYNMELLDAPLFELSSTDIRHLIASGGDVSKMMPPKVINRIRENKYYL